MSKHKGIDLSGKEVSGDRVMQRVIDAQARVKELERMAKALQKDRDQLLDEFTDLRNARPVPVSPRREDIADCEHVRVSMGDMHGMRQDPAAVSAFLADLEVIQPDQIVLGGDLLECGGWLAKHQPVGFVALSDYSYQEDVEAANTVLDAIQSACPNAEVIYFEGNHEDRVERWCVDQTQAHKRDAEFLRAAFAPDALLRLEDRGIQYIRRSICYEEGLPRGWVKLGKMFFTHELKGGKNAANKGAESTAGNVRYFHTHRQDSSTVVFPGVGMIKAYSPGCLCQRQPVWKHSDPSGWSQGYDIDFIASDGRFQVPIWEGESLATSIIQRFAG